ncbi:MAG: hypothetical protein ACOYNY_23640 [Caldilineaceae bacterium]
MLLEDKTTVYIVRVWVEPREALGAAVTWRAAIEHVASGQITYLTKLHEITAFFRTSLAAMGVSLAEPKRTRLPGQPVDSAKFEDDTSNGAGERANGAE